MLCYFKWCFLFLVNLTYLVNHSFNKYLILLEGMYKLISLLSRI
nr:MAG TPA: hypothetical protein [Caudoviricetes sp.]